MMNAKLSPHRFWPCHENGLIKTIQTIPHNLYLSFKSASLYCGLRLILVYPNPQKREADLKLRYRLKGIVWIVLMSPFSWQCQNPCRLSLAFIIDWRVVPICWYQWNPWASLGYVVMAFGKIQRFNYSYPRISNQDSAEKNQNNLWWLSVIGSVDVIICLTRVIS